MTASITRSSLRGMTRTCRNTDDASTIAQDDHQGLRALTIPSTSPRSSSISTAVTKKVASKEVGGYTLRKLRPSKAILAILSTRRSSSRSKLEGCEEEDDNYLEPLTPGLEMTKAPADILTSEQAVVYNRGGRVGIYTPHERLSIITKFRKKRDRFKWDRKIVRYSCRKVLAEGRERVRGRFMKVVPADDKKEDGEVIKKKIDAQKGGDEEEEEEEEEKEEEEED
jgi:hypothetical protein